MLEMSCQILQILIARIAGHQMRHDSETKLIVDDEAVKQSTQTHTRTHTHTHTHYREQEEGHLIFEQQGDGRSRAKDNVNTVTTDTVKT